MKPAKTLDKELLRRVRKVQIHTKYIVNSLLAGSYRSAFKGLGIEFAQVRKYEPGDETRHIDWNVTARMQTPYVKIFQEERQLTAVLAVDLSGSLRFGSIQCSKQEVMAEIGAVLALSAIENNDRIGLLLFTDQIESYLPPKAGITHAMRVIRDLLTYEPKGQGTNISKALRYLARVQRRRCTCFLLSDFIAEGYEHAFRVAAKRYELIAVRVRDRHENTLPKLSAALTLQDLETGKSAMIDSSSSIFQDLFTKRIKERSSKQEQLFKKLGVGFLDIQTDEPYTLALKRFFEKRKR